MKGSLQLKELFTLQRDLNGEFWEGTGSRNKSYYWKLLVALFEV